MQKIKVVLRQQQGFTFLELLLVLAVVSVMTIIILPFSEKQLLEESEDDALNLFLSAVHEAQLYAITNKKTVMLSFKDNGSLYTVKETGADMIAIVEERFPGKMQLGLTSAMKELIISPSGYFEKTGRMTILTESKGSIRINFQFERGRMIIDG